MNFGVDDHTHTYTHLQRTKTHARGVCRHVYIERWRRREGGGVDPAGDWWVVAPCLKTARERERDVRVTNHERKHGASVYAISVQIKRTDSRDTAFKCLSWQSESGNVRGLRAGKYMDS